MKKLVSLFVALALCASLSVTVFAETGEQATEGQPNPEVVAALDQLMSTGINSQEEAIAAVETLKKVAAEPRFRSLDLYNFGNEIIVLEAQFLAFFPEYAPVINGPESATVVGATFSGYAAGGPVTINMSTAQTSAPYALTVDMTVGGASVQPATPILVYTDLPSAFAKNVDEYDVHVKHIRNDGSTEEFYGVRWFDDTTKSIIGVEFFVTGFSTFEFSLVAFNPSQGGGSTSSSGSSTPIKATSSGVDTGNFMMVAAGLSVLLAAAFVAGKKKASC